MKSGTKVHKPEIEEFDEHERIWGLIGAIVGAYSAKNGIGYCTLWGMLTDAYDKSHHCDLSYKMLSENISLKSASEKLWAAEELHDLAVDLFIKG